MARPKDQLVSEYLENIHGDVLTEYPQLVNKFMKGRHGIYALYHSSELYYVGLASNLWSRLRNHQNDRHKGLWDRFSIYLTNNQEHMKDLESLFLRIAKPTGNKFKGRFVQATRLNKRFMSDLIRVKKGEAYRFIGHDLRKPPAPQKVPVTAKRRGQEPVLSPYAGKGFAIRMDYKGKLIKARVKANGTIKYDGKLYTSPSVAGAKARGRKALNGWKSWKYKNERGEWVYLDELRKEPRKKAATAGLDKSFDTIICPARKDGFQEAFLGENCWYAIRINRKKIPSIKYIAMYLRSPVSAVTHYARVDKILPYKKTGKYIVKFKGKPRKLRKPIERKPGGWAPQASFFSTFKKIRSGGTVEDLRGK